MRHLFLLAITILMVYSFTLHADTKIVYGDDNRLDVKNVGKVSQLTKAIAGRVSNSKFQYVDVDGKQRSHISFKNIFKLSDMFGGNVCKDEKFSSQQTITDCTGFLVDEDILVTAGHCITSPGTTIQNTVNLSCARFSWLFDFQVNSLGVYNTSNIPVDKIVGCQKIIYATVDLKQDFAVIKLNRKVKGRTPLKFRKVGYVKNNQELFVIGHPSGLPMKYAGDAQVLENEHPNYFATNLDTFGGNSGSPVFNSTTKEVEGILVRGRMDYIPSKVDGERCMRVNTCDQNADNCEYPGGPDGGEQVTRISEILKFVK